MCRVIEFRMSMMITGIGETALVLRFTKGKKHMGVTATAEEADGEKEVLTEVIVEEE
ncbi:hypothetical protein BIW11_03615 [Tropilaelaps mercedesae]|uniref:Uncharacterized protein n=1 Tax=Tropilaelaps mercedesae TaxID=418985 RepID=A0A1V9XIS3_9ACAR|nr:hypothetical protein BIW11_03615 [Tropilaelaps mercedesae]